MHCNGGELAGRIARAKSRQHKMHVLSASIAQAFVLELRGNKFNLGEL